MLHMFRSCTGWLAVLLVALLLTPATVSLGAQAPEPSAPAQEVRHAGGEANLILPDLGQVTFQGINGRTLLMFGLAVCVLGLLFGMVIFVQLRNLPVHRSMRDISVTSRCSTANYSTRRTMYLKISGCRDGRKPTACSSRG